MKWIDRKLVLYSSTVLENGELVADQKGFYLDGVLRVASKASSRYVAYMRD